VEVDNDNIRKSELEARDVGKAPLDGLEAVFEAGLGEDGQLHALVEGQDG
jgi:hypothetical protein